VSGRRGEHHPISTGIRVAILATMDRKSAEQAQERADDRMAEQRALASATTRRGMSASRSIGSTGVLMVGGDDQRPRFRNVLEADTSMRR